MVLNLWDTLKNAARDSWNFISNNYENYFFWIIIFAVLLIIGLITISKFANK